MPKKLIYIIDDCEIFCLGARTILEKTKRFEIIEGNSSCELFSLLEKSEVLPELILLDVKLKKFGSLDGIETASLLKKKYPEIKILILTSFDEKEILKNALIAGVEGFLPKEAVSGELVVAIDCVLNGQNYLGKNTSFDAINFAIKKSSNKVDLLSKTEYNIFIMICKGMHNNQIAEISNISVHTVETHKTNIKNKLSLKSDIDYLKIAIEEGIEDIMKFYKIQYK